MSTTGLEIKGFILEEMGKHPEFNINHETLQLFCECVGIGVYRAMQKLDDNTGTLEAIPSVGHS